MRIDVNAFVGAYPWRRVPGTSPESLLQAMDLPVTEFGEAGGRTTQTVDALRG